MMLLEAMNVSSALSSGVHVRLTTLSSESEMLQETE